MEDCEEEEMEAKQQTPFITARDQYVSWKAENPSGPTQNQVMEIAWIAQKCNNILYEHVIRNFEIRKFSAVSEMHFESIPMLGGTNSTFVG